MPSIQGPTSCFGVLLALASLACAQAVWPARNQLQVSHPCSMSGGALLVVRVLDHDRKPVESPRRVALPALGCEAEADSGAGTLELQHVPPGRYELRSVSIGYRPGQRWIRVGHADTVRVTVTLLPHD